jgi:hypothetical protein
VGWCSYDASTIFPFFKGKKLNNPVTVMALTVKQYNSKNFAPIMELLKF